MSRFRMPLKAVLYKEDDVWLAHCLELDLIGDGANPSEAISQLSEAIIIQIKASVKHSCADTLFTPADGRVWRMFAQGKNVSHGNLALTVKSAVSADIEIEDVETREYSGTEVPEGDLASSGSW